MENSKGCSLGVVAAAAVVGGLAGAVVGLLLAPKTGRDLRRDLQDKAETLATQVEDSQWLEKGRQLAEDLHSFLKEFQNAHQSGYTSIKVYPSSPENKASGAQAQTQAQAQAHDDPLSRKTQD